MEKSNDTMDQDVERDVETSRMGLYLVREQFQSDMCMVR